MSQGPTALRSSQSSSPSEFAAITAITLFALALRVWKLQTPSLWYDEGATLWFSVGGSEKWILDTHPPLYYAMVHFWLRFGNSETWLRILSVIPAVATIPVVFSLGRKMFGTMPGLLSATFLTLLSFHIDHSQQARMYTFLVFFYSCTLWALIRAVRDGQRWHWGTYLLAASLMSYTQGIGILYVATIAVLFPVISSNPYKVSEWIPFVLANLMVFGLFIPWLIVLSHAHFRTGFLNWVPGPTWISVPGTLFAFICRYIPFTSIPYSGHRFLLAVAVAAAMVPALALFWIGLRRAFSLPAKWAAVTAASTFVLPIVLVFLLSVLVTPMYIDRVLLPAAVGFVLILGASVAKTKLWTSPPYRWIAIVLAISCLNVYYYFQYRDREDFRSLSTHLQRSVKPGQSILYVADSGLPQFLIEYYDPEMKLAKARKFDIRSILRSCQKNLEECLDAQTAEFKNSEILWIVYAHDTSLPDRQALQHWLDTRFLTISTQSYTLPDRLRLSETKPSRF